MAPLVTNQVLCLRKVARAESTRLADSCVAAGAAAAVAAASSWCRHIYFWWHWRGEGRAGMEGGTYGGTLRGVCSSRVLELRVCRSRCAEGAGLERGLGTNAAELIDN